MRPPALVLAFLLLISGFAQASAQAQVGGFMAGLAPARLCRPAIDMAERRHGIPSRLLQAIGRVESGKADPATGQVNPWPWTANAEGQGFYFNTKAEAIAAITGMRAKGMRSIDVGCMQINLLHHPDAFSGLEQAFDPMANADYAGRFLRKLFDQTGSWQKAAAWYHSATPELGEAYQKRVMAVWPEEQKLPAATGPTALAAAWGATLAPPIRPAIGRVLPATGGGDASAASTTVPGRTLDAYRAAPITWVYRPVAPPVTRVATARGPIAPRVSADRSRPSVHFLR